MYGHSVCVRAKNARKQCIGLKPPLCMLCQTDTTPRHIRSWGSRAILSVSHARRWTRRTFSQHPPHMQKQWWRDEGSRQDPPQGTSQDSVLAIANVAGQEALLCSYDNDGWIHYWLPRRGMKFHPRCHQKTPIY